MILNFAHNDIENYMGKIKQLPEQIISKIAAGEVIERPAFAVKELVENAIDANADWIQISIEDAGLKRIQVIDNGEGMGREDVLESFKPHTTSKIFSEDKLHNIRTMGFRGEALSSIAAVSNVTIKSRLNNENAGTQVEIQGGEIVDVSPIGMPNGTTIIVDNLFSSVPARKKFLKSPRTEYRHILEIIMHNALVFPETRFTFSHNERTIFDLPKTDDLESRVQYLLGSSMAQELLPVDLSDSYISVKGYISKPQLSSQNQHKSFLFVNNRKVSDKLISLAIKEAYGNLLESTKYPIFIIFLTLPYELVDVNVHPRKEQVHFINTDLVFEKVHKAITLSLSNGNLTFHSLRFKSDASPDLYAGKLLKETVDIFDVRTEVQNLSDVQQIHHLYLIVQTKSGLLLIDQHGAHERILYGQFKSEFEKQKNKSYSLPQPISLELSLSEKELLEENMGLFGELGLSFEQFHGAVFQITKVPHLFKDRDIKSLVREFLDQLHERGKIDNIDSVSTQMLEYLACRTAIMAGEKLTKVQSKRLIEKLEQTPNNTTCPHGRPTKVEISLSQLHRWFRRT